LALINAWLRKVPLNFDLANAKVLQTAEIILQDLANRVLNTGMNEPQFLNFMRVIWESQDGSRS